MELANEKLIGALETLGALLDSNPDRRPEVMPKSYAQTETVKVTFNVASVDKFGVALEESERYQAITYLYEKLSDRFGGASSYEGFGVWRDDSGNVVREANTFVYSYASRDDVVIEVLEGIARILARRLRQDAVMLSVEPIESVSFVSSR